MPQLGQGRMARGLKARLRARTRLKASPKGKPSGASKLARRKRLRRAMGLARAGQLLRRRQGLLCRGRRLQDRGGRAQRPARKRRRLLSAWGRHPRQRAQGAHPRLGGLPLLLPRLGLKRAMLPLPQNLLDRMRRLLGRKALKRPKSLEGLLLRQHKPRQGSLPAHAAGHPVLLGARRRSHLLRSAPLQMGRKLKRRGPRLPQGRNPPPNPNKKPRTAGFFLRIRCLRLP